MYIFMMMHVGSGQGSLEVDSVHLGWPMFYTSHAGERIETVRLVLGQAQCLPSLSNSVLQDPSSGEDTWMQESSVLSETSGGLL